MAEIAIGWRIFALSWRFRPIVTQVMDGYNLFIC